jgi:TonB C terminal
VRSSIVFQVVPGDERPPSLLSQGAVSTKMAVGGVLAALSAHLLVPGAVVLALAFLSASGLAKQTRPTIDPERIVEARFVKLGKKLDPKKLPNRKVPMKTTAPPQGVAVSKVMEPPKPEKPPEERPPEPPEEDLLTRLGDRAQAFAEIAEQQEQEGDPGGIAEGTETEARAGDLYRGQLVSFFKRGWTIPTTLDDTSHLVTRAAVEITAGFHVGAHEIVKSSGNALFDQSVEDRFNELRAQGTTLPEPPPEVADQFSGTWSVEINFIGRK